MVIFGRWRQFRKIIWPVYKFLCKHCHNENYFYLQRITTWFTLFFIPIFPYERYYFLYCPTCNYWVKLNEEEAQKMIPIAKLNSALNDWTLTQQEYESSMKMLSDWSREDKKELTADMQNNKEFKKCPLCWKDVKTVAKKCKHCKGRIE